MKTLFVSDLDGTLLTAKETVSEYSMRVYICDGAIPQFRGESGVGAAAESARNSV